MVPRARHRRGRAPPDAVAARHDDLWKQSAGGGHDHPLHIGIAFLVFGIVAAALISGAEQQPLLVLRLAILVTALEVLFFGAIVIAAKWVLDELSGWALFLGNVFAAAAMLWYFFVHHRALATRIIGPWEDD